MLAPLTTTLLVFSSASASVFPHGLSDPLSQVQDAGEAQSQTKSNCPEKWLDASFVEMGCLFFNSTASMTWEDANLACQRRSNSTSLVITSEIQMGFLQMELDVIANAEGTTHHWWTAGTDIWTNGPRWLWATTLADVEEYVWYDGQPTSTTYYNCLYLERNWGYLGRNTPCADKLFPICQLK